MKIICLKNHLREAITICEKITGKNLNLPILSHILIDGEGSELKIIATNLEQGIEMIIPGKVEKKGKITVPGNILNSLLSNISHDNITLELQNNNLIISTPNHSTLIRSQSADDFPKLPKIESNKDIFISCGDFINGLKSVLYACSNSMIKPEISSVYLHSDKSLMMTFAATDSFRLAEKKINYFFEGFGPLLIPIKTTMEMVRIFDGKEGKINITYDKNQINIESEGVKFISRLTDGMFPDYNQIIPKKFITDVVTLKEDFINSLKIAGVFSGKLNELAVAVSASEEFFTIKTANNEVGENISKIPAQITGEDIKINFNHRYIFDCLSSINSEKILLRFAGEGKPLLITGTQDNNFQYLVMPMSV